MNWYKSFLQSPYFTEFIQQNPNAQKGICISYFMEMVCQCVRKLEARSCVDVSLSKLEYLSLGIFNAITYNNIVRDIVEGCTFLNHLKLRIVKEENKAIIKKARELNKLPEGIIELPKMLDTIVAKLPLYQVDMSCCDRVPNLDFDHIHSNCIPSFIPWICTHGI